MPKYAESTGVSVAQSRQEIEDTLLRYGATGFMSGWDEKRAFLGFVLEGRQVRMFLALPDKESFRYTPERRLYRTDKATTEAWEQGCRQRWRALLLVVKAKLEAVDAGISTIEDEFLSHIVLPDGQTVAQFMKPQIKRAYETGAMPALLPSGEGR